MHGIHKMYCSLFEKFGWMILLKHKGDKIKSKIYMYKKNKWLLFLVFFLLLYFFGQAILLVGWWIMLLDRHNWLSGVLWEVWYLLFLFGWVWNKVLFLKFPEQIFVLIGALFWNIHFSVRLEARSAPRSGLPALLFRLLCWRT